MYYKEGTSMKTILNDEERVQIALGIGKKIRINIYGWEALVKTRRLGDDPIPHIYIYRRLNRL